MLIMKMSVPFGMGWPRTVVSTRALRITPDTVLERRTISSMTASRYGMCTLLISSAVGLRLEAVASG